MKGNLFCKHLKDTDIHPTLRLIIETLEQKIGEELFITRGAECPECNSESRGKNKSAHVPGNNSSGKCEAVDFGVRSDNAFKIMENLIYLGVKRIGIKRVSGESGFIHADIGIEADGHPTPRIWTY